MGRYLGSYSLIFTSSLPFVSVHWTLLLLVNPLGNSLNESFESTAWMPKTEPSANGFFRLLFRCIFLLSSSTASSVTGYLQLLVVEESNKVSERCTGPTLGGNVSFTPAEASEKQTKEAHPRETWSFLEASCKSGLTSCSTNWYYLQVLIHFSSLGLSRETLAIAWRWI